MSMILTLVLQTAVPLGPVPVGFDLAGVRPIDFSLDAGRGPAGCASADPSTILVCGRRQRDGDYRFDLWAREFAERPLRAEARLFGDATAAVHGESVALDRGAISHRVVLRIRMPF